MAGLCEDTLYLKCKKSNDPSVQVVFLLPCYVYCCLRVISTRARKGICSAYKLGMCATLLDIVGLFSLVSCHLSISFALILMWISGPQGSTTPRLGDGAVSAQILGSTRRAGVDDLGCTNLFRGTPDIGTCRVVDSGYVHLDRNTRAANDRLGNPSLQEWCRQVTYLSILCLSYTEAPIANLSFRYTSKISFI